MLGNRSHPCDMAPPSTFMAAKQGGQIGREIIDEQNFPVDVPSKFTKGLTTWSTVGFDVALPTSGPLYGSPSTEFPALQTLRPVM